MPKKSTSEPWDALEHDVEMLFRAAGYDTERNAEIGGFEFDLLARRDEFAGLRVCIAVECKYREDNAVSNTDIHTFINAYNASRDRLSLTHGIVVTNSRFSRQAHEGINQHSSLKLLTYSNLEDELLGAQAYLNSASKHYRSHLKSQFIDLAADVQSGMSTTSSIPRIVDHLTSQVASNEQLFAMALGDFGSGKTTVAEQIHKACAEAYLSRKSNVFPIIFYLRTLAQFDTEQAYINSQMTQFSRAVSPELFSRIQNGRKALLILDGFDEVATHSTAEERMLLFSRVMRISQRSSHLIITSRPSTFTNLTEINDLITSLIARDFSTAQKPIKRLRRADADRDAALTRTARLIRQRQGGGEYRLFPADASSVYYLKPFSRRNIIDYLAPFADQIRRKHKKSVEQVYDLLSKVYDVTDLITRPLLLEMFVEILLDGGIRLDDPDLEIGPSGLYQTYVNLHLDRDWKVRQFLTREERLTFARAAAVVMLKSGGSLEASYPSIERIVSSGMGGIAEWRWEELKGKMAQVVNDVRVCAFMNITRNDRIEFAHKSFMEYFIADVIVSKLSLRKPIEELRAELTYEILYFVGSYCLIRSDHRIEILNHIKDIAYAEDSAYSSRIKLALLYSERISRDRNFEAITFDGLKVRKKEFQDCELSKVHLTRAHFEDVDFAGCHFSEARFDGEFDRVNFRGVSGSIGLAGGMRACKFDGVDELSITSSRGELNFQSGEWVNSTVLLDVGKVGFAGARLTDVHLELENVTDLVFEKTKMKGGKISPTLGRSPLQHPAVTLHFTNSSFENVALEGLVVGRETYIAIETGLTGCYGYVIVEDDAHVLRSFMQKVQSEKTVRYVGWTAVGRILFVAAHRMRTGWNSIPSVLTSSRTSEAEIRKWAEQNLT